MVQISSDGEKILGLSVAMIILTGLAVVLRFITRLRTKASLAADDWWAVTSLVFYYTYMGLRLWSKLCGSIS